MNLTAKYMNEIIEKGPSPEQVQAYMQMQEARAKREKFMKAMIEFVEKSVMGKKKEVKIPISRREDISELRHLIRRISKGLGYNVKSMKKRCIVVENTRFIVEKIKKSEYNIEKGVNKSKSE